MGEEEDVGTTCAVFSQEFRRTRYSGSRGLGGPGLTGVVRAADAHGICLKHPSSPGPFRRLTGEGVCLVGSQPTALEVRQHPSRPAAPEVMEPEGSQTGLTCLSQFIKSI